VLETILQKDEVKAPTRFELSFKGLAQLPSQLDNGDGLAMVTTYLYSAGYVPDYKEKNERCDMPRARWSQPFSSFFVEH
jgi:hypothetical protein